MDYRPLNSAEQGGAAAAGVDGGPHSGSKPLRAGCILSAFLGALLATSLMAIVLASTPGPAAAPGAAAELLETSELSTQVDTMAVWTKMFAKWGAGYFSGPDAVERMKGYVTPDMVNDAGYVPGVPEAKKYFGARGMLEWLDWWASKVDFKILSSSASIGPEPNVIVWFWTLDCTNRKTGYKAELSGVDTFKYAGDKLQELKIYWGEPTEAAKLLDES